MHEDEDDYDDEAMCDTPLFRGLIRQGGPDVGDRVTKWATPEYQIYWAPGESPGATPSLTVCWSDWNYVYRRRNVKTEEQALMYVGAIAVLFLRYSNLEVAEKLQSMMGFHSAK